MKSSWHHFFQMSKQKKYWNNKNPNNNPLSTRQDESARIRQPRQKHVFSPPPPPPRRAVVAWGGVGGGGVPLNRRELIIPDINGQKKKQNNNKKSHKSSRNTTWSTIKYKITEATLINYCEVKKPSNTLWRNRVGGGGWSWSTKLARILLQHWVVPGTAVAGCCWSTGRDKRWQGSPLERRSMYRQHRVSITVQNRLELYEECPPSPPRAHPHSSTPRGNVQHFWDVKSIF